MRNKYTELLFIRIECLTTTRTVAAWQVVRSYSQKQINRESAINDFSTNDEIPSMLEASVLKRPEVHGGSGFGAATVQDLGIEPT